MIRWPAMTSKWKQVKMEVNVSSFERKELKQYRKRFQDFLIRKQKYENDMKILGKRNSYLKTEKQKKETTGKFIITKNGSSKKNILERSFQKKKLVKFTASVKQMQN